MRLAGAQEITDAADGRARVDQVDQDAAEVDTPARFGAGLAEAPLAISAPQSPCFGLDSAPEPVDTIALVRPLQLF